MRILGRSARCQVGDAMRHDVGSMMSFRNRFGDPRSLFWQGASNMPLDGTYAPAPLWGQLAGAWDADGHGTSADVGRVHQGRTALFGTLHTAVTDPLSIGRSSRTVAGGAHRARFS